MRGGRSVLVPPGSKRAVAAYKSSRCEQDLNLRRETPLDFKSNAFTTRPSQQLALEGSSAAQGSRPASGKGTGPDRTLDMGSVILAPMHTQHRYHCYCHRWPCTELR